MFSCEYCKMFTKSFFDRKPLVASVDLLFLTKNNVGWFLLKRVDLVIVPITYTLSGFDLSIWSAIVKIYPLTALCWANKDENMQPSKFSQSSGQYISQGCWKKIIAWKYHPSGPAGIYLFKFNIINGGLAIGIDTVNVDVNAEANCYFTGLRWQNFPYAKYFLIIVKNLIAKIRSTWTFIFMF